jgi:aminobenzoyl-glutamate utilization protein A
MDFQEMVTLRRDIHRYAEPAFLEIRTSSLVAARLDALGVDCRRGGEAMSVENVVDYPPADTRRRMLARALETGGSAEHAELAVAEGTAVIAEIEGSRPGPSWAIRCDIDALPLTEATDSRHLPWRRGFACEDGFMHACGHDGHVVIGLALAARLADRDFGGRVRVLFEPAEEGGRGARAMLAAGAVADVDRFVAVHLGFGEPVGTIYGGCEGLMATNKLRAVFRGKAAHAAAAPELGRNALVGAATALLNVLALPRFAAADTRVNVGTLHGGDNVNIIPARAEMTLEARSTDSEVCRDLTERVESVLRAAAAMHALDVDIQRTGGSTTIRCDRELVEAVSAVASSNGALYQVNGSDDASLFAREVQGYGGAATYMIVGGANEAPHHTALFDIDEESMLVAVDALEGLIRRS